MPFCHLIGNVEAKRILEKLLERKNIPSPLLFCGPEGVGKKQFALSFAKALLGAFGFKRDPVDLHLYIPEGKSYIHPISAIENFVKEMSLPPFEALYKVFIIDEAEKMPPASSNALLKTLEEPNVDSIIVLISSKPEDIIPTILSRCRRIFFQSLTEKEIFSHLKERLEEKQARKIAFLSRGSISRALSFVEQGEDPKRKQLLEILSCELYLDPLSLQPMLTKLCKYFDKRDQEETLNIIHKEADSLFEEILDWFRDLHVLSLGGSLDQVIHLEDGEVLQKISKKRLPSLEQILDLTEKSRLALQRSIKAKIVFEYFFTELAKIHSS